MKKKKLASILVNYFCWLYDARLGYDMLNASKYTARAPLFLQLLSLIFICILYFFDIFINNFTNYDFIFIHVQGAAKSIDRFDPDSHIGILILNDMCSFRKLRWDRFFRLNNEK